MEQEVQYQLDLYRRRSKIILIYTMLVLSLLIFSSLSVSHYNSDNTGAKADKLSPLFTTNNPPPPNSGWSQWLGNASKNSVFNTTSPMVADVLWNRTIPSGMGIKSTPFSNVPEIIPQMIEYNHSIITGGDNSSYLYSINATTGNINWVFSAGSGYIFNVSAVAANNVIMAVANNKATENAFVYGINASTGANLTYYNIYANFGKNFVATSPLLVTDSDGAYGFINVWRISAGSEGAVSFNLTFTGVTYDARSGWHAHGSVFSGMSNDSYIINGANIDVYAISNPATNTKYELQYVFLPNGAFSTTNTATNKAGPPGIYSWSSPLIINKGQEILFVYDNGGNWAVDTFEPSTNVNGNNPTATATLFSTGGPPPDAPTENQIFSTPLYYNGYFFIIANNYDNGGNAYILNYSYSSITTSSSPANPTATVTQSKEISSKYVYSNPVLSNGIIYVTSTDGYVYAFNATNFNILWRYNTGAPIYATPIISHGNLYVYNINGTLICFETPTIKGHVSFSNPGPLSNGQTVSSGSIMNISVTAGWYNRSNENIPFIPVGNASITVTSLNGGNFSNHKNQITLKANGKGEIYTNWTAPVVDTVTTVLFRIAINNGLNISYFYPSVLYRMINVSAAKTVSVSATSSHPVINMGIENYTTIVISPAVNGGPPKKWNLTISTIEGSGIGTINGGYGPKTYNNIASSSQTIKYNVTSPIYKGTSAEIMANISVAGYLNGSAIINIAIVPGTLNLSITSTIPVAAVGLNPALRVEVKNATGHVLSGINMNITAYGNYGNFASTGNHYITGSSNSAGVFTAQFSPVQVVKNETELFIVNAYGANYTNATNSTAIVVVPAVLNVSVVWNSSYIRPGATLGGYVSFSYNGSALANVAITASSTPYGTITMLSTTTNTQGIAYFTFQSSTSIYNVTEAILYFNGSYSSIGYGSNRSSITIVPNSTYPSKAIGGNITIQNPLLNYTLNVTSTYLNITTKNSTTDVGNALVMVTLSNPSAGELLDINKILTNNSKFYTGSKGFTELVWRGNSTHDVDTEYIHFLLNKSGYVNSTLTANITIMPAYLKAAIGNVTVNESSGEYGWINGSVENILNRPYGNVTVSVNSPEIVSPIHLFSKTGSFDIKIKVKPVNISRVYSASITFYGNVSFITEESIPLYVKDATYMLNYTNLPAILNTPAQKSYTFGVSLYNIYTGYHPVSSYTIALSNSTLGSLSKTTVNGTNITDTFTVNTTMNVVKYVLVLSFSAYTSNGSAVYGNNTITIRELSTAFSPELNVSATPGIIYLKNPVNSTIVISVFNQATGKPVGNVSINISLSNSSIGYVVNPSGKTDGSGIYNSTFILNKNIIINGVAEEHLTVTAIYNKTYLFTNSTGIFINNTGVGYSLISLATSPYGRVIYPGSSLNVSIKASNNGVGLPGVYIYLSVENRNAGYTSPVYGYTGANGIFRFTFTSNYTNNSFAVESIVIDGSMHGYYNASSVYRIAVSNASGALTNEMSISILRFVNSTYSGGYLNLSLRSYNPFNAMPVVNVEIYANLSLNGSPLQGVTGTSNADGFVNLSLHIKSISKGGYGLLNMVAVKPGWNVIEKSYSVYLSPVKPSEAPVTTSNAKYTFISTVPWWLIIILIIILFAMIMMYINTGRSGAPSRKPIPPPETSIPKVPSPIMSKPEIIRAIDEEVPVTTPMVNVVHHRLPKIIKEVSVTEEGVNAELKKEDLEKVAGQSEIIYPSSMEFVAVEPYIENMSRSIPDTEISDEDYRSLVAKWHELPVKGISSVEYPGSIEGTVSTSTEPWVVRERSELAVVEPLFDGYPSVMYKGEILEKPSAPLLMAEIKDKEATSEPVKEVKEKEIKGEEELTVKPEEEIKKVSVEETEKPRKAKAKKGKNYKKGKRNR